MGRRMTLNPVVIFAAVTFGGFLWGILGDFPGGAGAGNVEDLLRSYGAAGDLQKHRLPHGRGSVTLSEHETFFPSRERKRPVLLIFSRILSEPVPSLAAIR
jgi:hypothetical protein